jgi:hypothetical protein
VTHCERVLELLADGREHNHHELYALNVVAHSRVAELRSRGHVITCETQVDHVTHERVSVYRLVSSPRADVVLAADTASASEGEPLRPPAGEPNEWGRTGPAGDLNEVPSRATGSVTWHGRVPLLGEQMKLDVAA